MIIRDLSLWTGSISAERPDAEKTEYDPFMGETACVSDLYRRCLPKVVTRETAKVLVDLKESDDWVVESNIQRLLNVTISPWKIRFADYWALTPLERRRFALDTLHDGLTWLARIEGWPLEPFETARRTCLERNLVNEFLSKKTLHNPSKTAKARLFCEFDTHEARITAIVTQGRKERGRVYLGATVAEPYCVWFTLDSFRWSDDHTLQIQLADPYKSPPATYDLTALLTTEP